MSTTTRQANFLLPEDLIEEIRKSVSRREQSKFVTEALRKELKRMRFEKALTTSFGAWEDVNHPEIKAGTEEFVKNLRKSSRAARSR